MAKGKAKIDSNEDLALPQTRSLRLKKRATSTDEASETHQVQAALLQKNTDGDIKEVDNMLLQSNLQDSATVTNEEEEQSCLSKPDESNIENNSEGTNASDMANKEREETMVDDPNRRFEIKTCGVQANDCTDETASEQCSRLPSQPQTFVSNSEDDSESSCAALEKQAVEKEHSNLKRNQDTNEEVPSFHMRDVKEWAVGLPAKKKRRMGMCGLTEKERSHFLQAQQGENAQIRAGSPGTQTCGKTSERVASADDVSSAHLQSTPPPISAEVEEQSKEEPSHSGDEYRAETEVHSVVTSSDGAGTTSNPGCSETRSSEAKEGYSADPELKGNTEPNQPAEEEKEEHLENLQPPEVKESTTSKIYLMPKIQTGEDLLSKVPTDSFKTFFAKQQEEGDAEGADPQMCRVKRTTDEGNLEMNDAMGDDGAEEGASPELNCSSEKLHEASLTPAIQEMNYSYDPSDDPTAGPSVVHTEHTRTRDPEDSSGPGCIDYVSDSQLNTIVIIEEREAQPDSQGRLEDATELVCGLIRELSSLNRIVMVAHRELENLRRKPSRSSVR
ncbi:uncharacterized protein si:ch211-286b5.2 [Girardinichthys multiradiatus]|uniref:uncharacterized protein si:ch211-286b5.2 n=1 Tax=Girardinichthys multiradiatus TaxID=208333 RepID=UPI001FAC9ECE|nr:uncharacterized protein si:ch211-286b5.2 [Girardinichthys multiradiatus]XP_047222475.1 uncharacterized protein si:ch211-286b5.2 [Girardinichthys multiradiatus]